MEIKGERTISGEQKCSRKDLVQWNVVKRGDGIDKVEIFWNVGVTILHGAVNASHACIIERGRTSDLQAFPIVNSVN